MHRKLDALSPKARLGIILAAFAVFSSLCLYMITTAVIDFGKGNGTMEIRHMKKLNLPVRDSMNRHNDAGS